ncbi:hypothetical protein PInf_018956 [Phytophthora infestans]|nr:hypothetical protein PInf_018956 [Phytophthora infestans]
MTVEGESRCLDPRMDPTKTEDEQVCYREGGDLHAEDLGEDMAVIPEVPRTTEEITIADIQVDPEANEPTEVDRLHWDREDEILGVLAASITPRAKMDEALNRVAPKKEPKRRIQILIPTVQVDEDLSTYAEGLAVNEAEYNGLLLGLDLLKEQDPKRLVICGDSNLVIRQVRGEIDCKAPALTLLRQKVMIHLRGWMNHELVHVKRDWNASADSLASAALRNQCGVEVEREAEHQDLVTLSRLDEVVVVGSGKRTVQVMAVTRSRGRIGSSPQILEETFVKRVRIDRILKAQNENAWILGLTKYLMGDVRDLSRKDA